MLSYGGRRGGPQEPRPELLAVRAVVHPLAGRRNPFTSGDRGGVADDGDEIAVATRFDAQHTKAVLGVVERDPLHSAREHFLRAWSGFRPHGLTISLPQRPNLLSPVDVE